VAVAVAALLILLVQLVGQAVMVVRRICKSLAGDAC
jgi:hypothetical protein